MSIEPRRVIARITAQVDQSDWPCLEARVFASPEAGETIHFYVAQAHPRYATPIHFWVHALRDELATRGRRADLFDEAGQALCLNQDSADWLASLARFDLGTGAGESIVDRLALRDRVADAGEPRAYRMRDSVCRRSSVVDLGTHLMAHFWGHGFGESWRAAARPREVDATSGCIGSISSGLA